MPFRFKQLVFSFFIFYLIWEITADSIAGDPLNLFRQFSKKLSSSIVILAGIVSFFAYTISSYYFLWYFSQKKKHLFPFLSYLGIILCVPLVIFFRYLLQEVVLYKLLDVRNYHYDIGLADYFSDNLGYAPIFTSVGIVFYYVQNNRYKDYLQQELKIQNRQAELDYLKYQINPHLLFNTLNNIYSLVYHKAENALPAIEKLSGLMRYMLYNKDEFVPLSEEINYIRNYIDLQKMRYNYEAALQVQFEVEKESIMIAPLLLLPFVENIFKHGCLSDKTNPATVHLNANDRCLFFWVSNKKGLFEKDATTGIGLTNLKRRLNLLYPEKHELVINETDHNYSVNLKIELQ